MSTVSQTGSRPGALEAMIHRSNDVGELLREDDSLLRQQFFSILREHHPKVPDAASIHEYVDSLQ